MLFAGFLAHHFDVISVYLRVCVCMRVSVCLLAIPTVSKWKPPKLEWKITSLTSVMHITERLSISYFTLINQCVKHQQILNISGKSGKKFTYVLHRWILHFTTDGLHHEKKTPKSFVEDLYELSKYYMKALFHIINI